MAEPSLENESELEQQARAAGEKLNVLPFPAGRSGPLRSAQAVEARLFCLSIVRDPEYRKALRTAALARVLPPVVEKMLWHYAYGKPPDKIELQVSGDGAALSEMSLPELAQRAQALAKTILELPAKQEGAEDSAEAEMQAQLSLDDALRLRPGLREVAAAKPKPPVTPNPAPRLDAGIDYYGGAEKDGA